MDPCKDVPAESRGLRCRMRDGFRKFAMWTSEVTGSAWAFVVATLICVLWAASYPLFKQWPDGFNSWQMVINTITNLATFLMVFLIQNMQNRDAKAIHLKLDELIRAMHTARNEMMSLEKLTDDEMAHFEKEFDRIRGLARAKQPLPTPAPPVSP